MGFFGFYFYGWLNGDWIVSMDFFFFLCLASMIVIGITPSFFFLVLSVVKIFVWILWFPPGLAG